MKTNCGRQLPRSWLPATKHDLDQLEQKIMLTQAEAAAQIRSLTAQIAKIGTETSKTLQKVTDLEAVITAGGNVSPEVEAALADAKTQAQATDDLVPDDTTPPTPPT